MIRSGHEVESSRVLCFSLADVGRLAIPSQHGQVIEQKLDSLDDSKRTVNSILDSRWSGRTRNFVWVDYAHPGRSSK